MPTLLFERMFPLKSFPEARQFSCSSFIPGIFQAPAPVLEFRMSPQGINSLRWTSGTSAALHSTLQQFTARIYGYFFSQHGNPKLGIPMWGWESSLFKGFLCSQDILFLNPHSMGVAPAHSISAPTTSVNMISEYPYL